MRKFLVATAAITMCGFNFTAPALAADAEIPAYSKHSDPIADSNGRCVRTKWMDADDPCNPKPATVVVAEPAPPPPPPPMPEVSLEQRTIYFDFDSAVLLPEAKAKLDALAQVINASTAVGDVRIHGFTDQFGTSSYNEVLANKRAGAVKTYLDTQSRLDSTVAEVKGLGKSSPTEGCGAMKKRAEKIECMATERRVEIELKAQHN